VAEVVQADSKRKEFFPQAVAHDPTEVRVADAMSARVGEAMQDMSGGNAELAIGRPMPALGREQFVQDQARPSSKSAPTDLIVALRMAQLLAMPFRTAMHSCAALRRHVEEQEDSEDVADEFEDHWNTNAPEALRHVLEGLLRQEWLQEEQPCGLILADIQTTYESNLASASGSRGATMKPGIPRSRL